MDLLQVCYGESVIYGIYQPMATYRIHVNLNLAMKYLQLSYQISTDLSDIFDIYEVSMTTIASTASTGIPRVC
jgi:hypothetical protein